MSFLTTFINPSFLLCLGIIVIVGGLLYIQTESKAREQNHKISSMLSLVSSLANEVNSIKHVLQVRSSNRLIDVSDDEPEEDSDAESDNESDSDDEHDDKSDDENIEIEVEEVPECLLDTINSTIKVLKLDIGTVLNNTDDEDSSTSSDDLDDLESEISFHEEINPISTYDLKTIQLSNLEDTVTVIVDYKKMSVQMLKSVIKEKELSMDPSKLKKPELLKLLGV